MACPGLLGMVHGALLCGRSMRSYRCTAVLDMTGCGDEIGLRALLEAASPRFKTWLSTDWSKTRNLAGIIRSANSQPASITVLSRKDNIFTEQAPPSENACNHGFR